MVFIIMASVYLIGRFQLWGGFFTIHLSLDKPQVAKVSKWKVESTTQLENMKKQKDM